jgi:hypothetical protein
MRYTKTVLAFGTFALGLAMAASSHHVTIFHPTWLNGNELKPGDYRVEVDGNKATITGNKTTIEVPATVSESTQKYPTTSFRLENVNGKQQLEEIQFGGTKTSILFGGPSAVAGGSE